MATKPYKELRNRMTLKSRKSAAAKTEKMLKEIEKKSKASKSTDRKTSTDSEKS